MREEISKYAKIGWEIFALMPGSKLPYKNEGVHSCNGRGGLYCATTDIGRLSVLFHDHNANIAVRTGRCSGLLVLDIDSGEKDGRFCVGHLSLEALEAELGELPNTVEQITTSGGRQRFFVMPESDINCSAGLLGKDLDVRADGGYAVLPPSVVNMKRYEWLSDQGPFEIKLKELPLAWVEKLKSISSDKTYQKYQLPERVESGQRNNQIFKFACSLKAKQQMSFDEIFAACLVINKKRCFPPLLEEEVSQVVASACSYRNDSDARSGSLMCSNNVLPLDYAKKIKRDHKIIHSPAGCFYRYLDGFYQLLTENKIIKIISDDIGSRSSNFLSLVVKYLRSEAEVEISDLNSDVNIINLENGLFYLNSYELKEHDPRILSTIQMPIYYDETALCPLWDAALSKILVYEDQINLFQEFFGLCFTREIYNKALILLGSGRNGKSTLLNVLKEMVGRENVASVEPNDLGGGYNVAFLHNKLVNVCSEISVKGVISDGGFKKIVTGDFLQGRHIYGKPFNFDPFCKIIFATNTLPYADDKSEAFYDRLIIINFPFKFTEEKAKHNFQHELLKEKSGIFNWGMHGLKRLKERGRFLLSDIMKKRVYEYKQENNPIISFVAENCMVAKNAKITCKNLFQEYRRYCEDNNYKAYSQNKFGRELKRICPEIKRDDKARPICWLGMNIYDEHREVHEQEETGKLWDDD